MMMKNNGLLKWSLHKNKNSVANGKNWVHPAESLTSGHIAYLVKFLGVSEVHLPRGIEVVKECIQKLKLDEEIRRAEGGTTPKAELTISVEGVAVQEPKDKKILHQFPLHQISYCADDKEDKKFFSFIAKDGEVHRCFVFASEKLAEKITLTIGQAFDLAYKRFQESSGRELELKKEISALQKRVAELEVENSELRGMISLRSVDGNSNSSLSTSGSNIADLLSLPLTQEDTSARLAHQTIAEFAMTANEIEKRSHVTPKKVDIFDDDLFGSKPRGIPDGIEDPPKLSPPPPKGKKSTDDVFSTVNSKNAFGSDPFFTSSSSADPFGMSAFTLPNRIPVVSNGHSKVTNSSNQFGLDIFSTAQKQEQPKPPSTQLPDDVFSTLEMLDPLRHDDSTTAKFNSYF